MRSKQEAIKVWLLDEILRGKIVTPERVLLGTKVKAVDLGIQGQSSGLIDRCLDKFRGRNFYEEGIVVTTQIR